MVPLLNPQIMKLISSNSTNGNFTSSAFFQRYLKSIEDLDQIYKKMIGYMNNGTRPPNYDLEANFFVNDIIERDKGLSALKTERSQHSLLTTPCTGTIT